MKLFCCHEVDLVIEHCREFRHNAVGVFLGSVLEGWWLELEVHVLGMDSSLVGF